MVAAVSKRTRIFIGILLAYAFGVGVLMYRLLGDIDPRYRESAEESLVETAHLMAATIESASPDGALNAEGLRPVFQSLYARRFKANIYGFEKTRVELRVAVVDRAGRVVFDSQSRHEGEDFSQWRDVKRALNGEYGARATPDIDSDALAGRNYVADYVQTLTHEVKSPLSAIRGAAELLQEAMPDADRARFVANIVRETQRIQELVDRMMELTALESLHRLDQTEPVALRPLLEELTASAQASGAARGLRIALQSGDDASVEGDAFLLRRALTNLLDNAIDFSPA